MAKEKNNYAGEQKKIIAFFVRYADKDPSKKEFVVRAQQILKFDDAIEPYKFFYLEPESNYAYKLFKGLAEEKKAALSTVISAIPIGRQLFKDIYHERLYNCLFPSSNSPISVEPQIINIAQRLSQLIKILSEHEKGITLCEKQLIDFDEVFKLFQQEYVVAGKASLATTHINNFLSGLAKVLNHQNGIEALENKIITFQSLITINSYAFYGDIYKTLLSKHGLTALQKGYFSIDDLFTQNGRCRINDLSMLLTENGLKVLESSWISLNDLAANGGGMKISKSTLKLLLTENGISFLKLYGGLNNIPQAFKPFIFNERTSSLFSSNERRFDNERLLKVLITEQGITFLKKQIITLENIATLYAKLFPTMAIKVLTDILSQDLNHPNLKANIADLMVVIIKVEKKIPPYHAYDKFNAIIAAGAQVESDRSPSYAP